MTLRIVQQPGKRAGLPEAPSHRSVTAQEVSNLAAGEPREDAVPFLKDRAHVPAIPSHPALEVLAGELEQAAITAKSGCDLAILRRVDPIDEAMRERSLHGGSVCCSGALDQPVKYTPG